MCQEPTVILQEGERHLVACRYCWQCQANRINDLVGRCIAESHYSTSTLAVTLTYRDEGNGAAVGVLVYKHFQDFMKRLRRAGYSVRYIVAGEYGSKKGRSHWHAVLFFKGAAPQIVTNPADRGPYDIILPRWDYEKEGKSDPDARINWKPWPHGYSYFQQPGAKGFAYVLKYALKDTAQRVYVNHLAMSKKPVLGFEYICDLAQGYVDQGLAPQSYFYQFAGERTAKGKIRKFFLQGRSREIFLEEFSRRWEAQRGTPLPVSEVLDGWEDQKARKEIADDMANDTPHKAWRRRTGGISYIPETRFRFEKQTPQSERYVDLVRCTQIIGKVRTKAGFDRDVIVYRWADDQVTYIAQHPDPNWIGAQWHARHEKEALHWLSRVQIENWFDLGRIARPHFLPRYVGPEKRR